jgi:hypothetical protein
VNFSAGSNGSADQQQPTGCGTTLQSSGSSEAAASAATGAKRKMPTRLQIGSTSWRAVQFCSKPDGATIHECTEALGVSLHTVNCRMTHLLRRGFLWRAGIDRFNQRYFATEAARDAWVAEELPKLIAERKDSKRAKWREDSQRKHDKLRALGLMPPRRERPQKPVRETLFEMASCEHGASRREMAERVACSDGSLSMHLWKMTGDGRLHRGGPATRGARYFADPAHAAAYTQRYAEAVRERAKASTANRYQVAPPKASVPANVTIKARAAWNNAEPIIPKHVKVQRLPGYRGDPRFSTDPAVLSHWEEWKNRREVKHG